MRSSRRRRADAGTAARGSCCSTRARSTLDRRTSRCPRRRRKACGVDERCSWTAVLTWRSFGGRSAFGCCSASSCRLRWAKSTALPADPSPSPLSVPLFSWRGIPWQAAAAPPPPSAPARSISCRRPPRPEKFLPRALRSAADGCNPAPRPRPRLLRSRTNRAGPAGQSKPRLVGAAAAAVGVSGLGSDALVRRMAPVGAAGIPAPGPRAARRLRPLGLPLGLRPRRRRQGL